MKNILTFILLFMSTIMSNAQTKLLGTITSKTGEKLAFVAVSEDGTTNGTLSDIDGNFSITVKSLPTKLTFSFLGYQTYEQEISSVSNKINVTLEEDTKALEEVKVVAKYGRSRTENVIIGVENIQMSEMSKVPAIMGERDIIKSIQLLPGIKSEGDGSCGFQVRGGTPAQNLILLDNATIYNSGHLIGFFSAFNDEAISNAQLYKGQMPAQFGDASASVFDITTRSGSMEDYYFKASIGLLAAKFAAEGPIAKNKASFFVSARRSYFDLFLKATEKYKDKVLNFYDVNAKVTTKLGKKDMMNIMFFRSRDNMELDNKIAVANWGNTAASLDWFHRYGQNISGNTSLVYSNFDFYEGLNILNIDEEASAFVRHYLAKENIKYSPTENHNIMLGAQIDHIILKSAEWQYYSLNEKEQRSAQEYSAWLSDDIKTNFGLEISMGLRGVRFDVLGGSPYYNIGNDGEILDTLSYKSGNVVKSYYSLEPRFSFKYQFAPHQSIKGGYCRTSQNIHSVSENGMTGPYDRNTMSSNIIKPEIANQISFGYMAETENCGYEFSLEGYYKNVDNVYEYKDGKGFMSHIEFERMLMCGKGRAYGAEFYAKKNKGKFTGWISYTLSWSENKVDGINDNKWYTASNDRRHDIALVGMYKFNNKWDMSATWVYNTGKALTAPSAKYEATDYTCYYYNERNGYRAPAYHRMDVSFNRTKECEKCIKIWSFGIYNIYNHYNPYIISFENDDTKLSGTKTVQTSLFGIVPSVSFTIKF
ncbi:MAG: carboxypeptidase-like regulatory domain-containing protein [Bacteroidales bacterium]|nr:carboxypeptidase-like regulatory domain-containing protein [Bacteroidales bacterium]